MSIFIRSTYHLLVASTIALFISSRTVSVTAFVAQQQTQHHQSTSSPTTTTTSLYSSPLDDEARRQYAIDQYNQAQAAAAAGSNEDDVLAQLNNLGEFNPDMNYDPRVGPQTFDDVPMPPPEDDTCDIVEPPSPNCEVFKKTYVIQKPSDLLDFVLEDERLSVIKVYASWCKTCQAFDLRYRKLNASEGDKFSADGQLVQYGRVRFAEMDFNQNEELCRLLGATQLPYVIMHKGSQGKVSEFQCGPSAFQRVIDQVNLWA